MRHPFSLLVLILALLIAGCTSDTPSDEGQSKASTPSQREPTDPDRPSAPAVVHDVKCGCSIAGTDRCGNYIMIDGKWVPMVHPTLGKMEWCAQKSAGAKVETVGAMKDGKFIAESWKTVE